MSDKRRIDLAQILIEIGVITIGILIAYQLNSWNGARQLKQAERNVLSEIKSNLELDLSDLIDNQGSHALSLQLQDSLKSYVDKGVYNPEIPIKILRIFRDLIFIPQTSAFETLKAKGVDLITNDKLRIRILRLYDFKYNILSQLEASYAPGQFHKDFRYITDNYFNDFDISNYRNIKPKYKGVDWLKKPEIQIRLDLVKQERTFANQAYLEVIEEVESLIQDLETEIDKL